MENILNVVLPYIVTAIGGYLTVKIVKIVPFVISYIKAKAGLATYNKMKIVSLDIWKAINEDFRLGELVGSELETFENMIKKQFPNITDDTIRLLNKSLAGEINKDKPIVEKAIEAPTATEVPTDTNTPSTIISNPVKAAMVNEDILNQMKELISKL